MTKLLMLGTFESSLGSGRMLPIFTRCVQIVVSGLISAGEPGAPPASPASIKLNIRSSFYK